MPLLRRGFGGCFLVDGPRAAQDAEHPAVSFVARIFVDQALRLYHWHLRGPRLRPGRRVVDRERVQQVIGIDTRETLDEMHVRPGASQRRVLVEVLCVDDERGALPVTGGLAGPLRDVRARTSVERD